MPGSSKLSEIIAHHEQDLVAQWIASQKDGTSRNVEHECRTGLAALKRGAQSGVFDRIDGPEWAPMREFLETLSSVRARAGFTPSETATFVFSLKEPLFAKLRDEFAGDSHSLADETWRATLLLDKLGLYTVEAYQKSREQIIAQQQAELLELSTPVVRLWDEILALPLIGTLDSVRTQIVMQNLLEGIVDTRASIAIIDITGVPTVDTLVAQHLLKTVAAARLMGADCIISGIRPQIAQTIIHLGVDLQDVITKATLADAFALALERTGNVVAKSPATVR